VSEVELLADRFAVIDATHAIDLATGDPIVLTVASAGGPSDQSRWALRCDTLMNLRHRCIAPLIDYGACGATQRFEAWRCGHGTQGSGRDRERALHRATNFLRACGLTVGVESVRRWHAGPVVLLDAQAGYPVDDPRSADAHVTSIDTCGLRLQPRAILTALADLFAACSGDARPQAVALWGDHGIGKSTLLLETARLARLRGLVPVDIGLLGRHEFCRLFAGRTLCLIADDAPRAWNALVSATLGSPKPHILVMAGDGEVPNVRGLAVARIPALALASAVQPATLSAALAGRVNRAARRAGGVPGRFVAKLWDGGRTSKTFHVDRARPFLRVAEQPATYGVDDADEPVIAVNRRVWPAHAELATIRKRMEAARRLLERGRHAPGERLLRQALGGLERRGDWPHAAKGLLLLAASLLARGHANDARDTVARAGNYAQRAEDEPALVDAGILAGAAWIDLGRLDEAESVLGAALARARMSRDGTEARVSRVLARCAFWRGRFIDAQRLVEQGSHGDDRSIVRARALDARIAVGLHDLPSAVSLAMDSLARARAIGDTSLVAAAACAAAFAHLATGDLDASQRDAAAAVAAARAAREPLRAVRARLLMAESLRRRGRLSDATTILNRLAAVGPTSLPPIVRARVALVQDLARGMRPLDAATRHVRLTGLEALALFVPPRSAPFAGFGEALNEMLEILRLCQAAEEEQSVLSEVSVRLRRQLQAAAAGFVVRDGVSFETLASDGGRLDIDVGKRAIEAGVVVGPHQCGDRVEAAVPIKYGGADIGAVVVRWTLGSTRDHASAAAVLSTAATAVAPIVAAAVAHRARSLSVGTDLIGVSAAIAEMRLAIERAANAPFPVLVIGESGSGKELVARALHRGGLRRDRPFCALNCAALPDDLVEAELFGHARGAFTGAMAERTGVFEEAHSGTLFLDEIGELSLRAQAKVLRVIQEGELKRIGENLPRRVDVRLVAATNRDLHVEAAANRFRMDLLYRLDVIRIVVPPLRERRDDIGPLAEHFWREAAHRVGSRATLGAATIGALARYDWPGNVRELQNVLAALSVRAPKRGVVPPTALPPAFNNGRTPDTWRLDDARRTFEQRFVRAALARAGGHRARAASELGVTRQGLTKLMTRLGIE
jgi:DNA-binding NtrC family response regulator/tetratricopeptide (TPR) repeat protein